MDNSNAILQLLSSEDIFVLLYSHSHQAFHVETFSEHILYNRNVVEQGQSTDFIIIGIYPCKKACNLAYARVLDHLKGTQLSELTVEELLKSLA